MKVLFFTEISPFPITRGERIRSYGLLKMLSVAGHEVVALVGNEENFTIGNLDLDNVEFVVLDGQKEKNPIIRLFSPASLTVGVLNGLVGRFRPDVAILDYEFIGQYVSFFKKRKIPVIYGTHNAQADLTAQKPVHGLKNKAAKFFKVKLQKLHEKLYFSKADHIIVVSQQDKDYYAKHIPEDKIHILANFLDEKRYSKNVIAKRKNYFVMTANFAAYMNFEGLRWLMNEVWDEELDDKVELKIVGNESDNALKKISSEGSFKNVRAIGKVENIVPFISNAQATLIPLIHGSGSRLKCLEAMALKTPIITTPKGVEGVSSKNFIVAESVQEFKEAILNFHYDEVIANKLYEDFMASYSIEANKDILNRIIDLAVNNSEKT